MVIGLKRIDNMLLKDIFRVIEVQDIKYNSDDIIEINNIAYHTDQVTEASLFVAIKGYITDGHKYIDIAKSKGAVAVIVEDFQDLDILQIKVNNSRIALADLADSFYDSPSKKLKVIGITATNGKTTTSFMIDKILQEYNRNTGIIGTVEVKYDDVVIPSELTTPESLDLQKHISNMVDRGIDTLTMEVSSSAQELFRNRNIDFDIVTFNNLSREHIDQHGSFENYISVKSKLIKEAKEDAVAILNFDDDRIMNLSKNTKAKVLSYSLNNAESDFFISDLDLSSGKGVFNFNIKEDIVLKNNVIKKATFNIDLNVAGYSSVMNSVVAIIVALIEKVDIATIQKALSSFKGVERRFELIYDEKFKIIDDHFANTRNIEVTMSTLEKMDYNNFHFIYAIRGNRGVNLNRENAEEIVKWHKKLKPKSFVATLSRDAVTSKDKVSDDELDTFLKIMNENNIDVEIFHNLEDSIRSVLPNLGKKDVLLLSGCQGMDKGARFALNYILENKLTTNADNIITLLNNRIC